MKKKATLLIKNIERVYTMKMINKHSLILESAYIAIHHDQILVCSCGDFSHYIDSDTRIIDAANHIVVPSFIECDVTLPVVEKCDRVRKEMECFMEYMRNGTLSICADISMHARHDKNYHYEIIHTHNENRRYPIRYGMELLKQTKKVKQSSFCISSASDTYPIYNQLTYAQMLFIKEEVSAEILLKALTIHPAKRLGLPHLGSIETGKQADLLILSCHDLSSLFQSFGNANISQIVKKGLRIYPFLLI